MNFIHENNFEYYNVKQSRLSGTDLTKAYGITNGNITYFQSKGINIPILSTTDNSISLYYKPLNTDLYLLYNKNNNTIYDIFLSAYEIDKISGIDLNNINDFDPIVSYNTFLNLTSTYTNQSFTLSFISDSETIKDIYLMYEYVYILTNSNIYCIDSNTGEKIYSYGLDSQYDYIRVSPQHRLFFLFNKSSGEIKCLAFDEESDIINNNLLSSHSFNVFDIITDDLNFSTENIVGIAVDDYSNNIFIITNTYDPLEETYHVYSHYFTIHNDKIYFIERKELPINITSLGQITDVYVNTTCSHLFIRKGDNIEIYDTYDGGYYDTKSKLYLDENITLNTSYNVGSVYSDSLGNDFTLNYNKLVRYNSSNKELKIYKLTGYIGNTYVLEFNNTDIVIDDSCELYVNFPIFVNSYWYNPYGHNHGVYALNPNKDDGYYIYTNSNEITYSDNCSYLDAPSYSSRSITDLSGLSNRLVTIIPDNRYYYISYTKDSENTGTVYLRGVILTKTSNYTMFDMSMSELFTLWNIPDNTFEPNKGVTFTFDFDFNKCYFFAYGYGSDKQNRIVYLNYDKTKGYKKKDLRGYTYGGYFEFESGYEDDYLDPMYTIRGIEMRKFTKNYTDLIRLDENGIPIEYICDFEENPNDFPYYYYDPFIGVTNCVGVNNHPRQIDRYFFMDHMNQFDYNPYYGPLFNPVHKYYSVLQMYKLLSISNDVIYVQFMKCYYNNTYQFYPSMYGYKCYEYINPVEENTNSTTSKSLIVLFKTKKYNTKLGQPIHLFSFTCNSGTYIIPESFKSVTTRTFTVSP